MKTNNTSDFIYADFLFECVDFGKDWYLYFVYSYFIPAETWIN